MKIRILPRRIWLALATCALIIVSCNDDSDITSDPAGPQYVSDYSGEVQLAWNDLFLKVERFAPNYRPGPGPRALAYMGLAAYEGCVSGMTDHNSMADQFGIPALPTPDPQVDYHWPSVVHGIYRQMMPMFFPVPNPSVEPLWNDLVANWNSRLESEAGLVRFEASVSYGEEIGQIFWEWSVADAAGHDAYKDPFGTYDWEANYDGPGDWVPTYPGPGKGLFPTMTNWRTFVVQGSEKVSLPPSHYYMDYSENEHSEYYSQALQVYTKNAAHDYLTEWIGEFWSDDFPELTFGPGPRWVAVANQVVDKEDADLETSLEAYAKVGVALNDAVVSCWHSKYLYNVERPETYIRAHIDPNYKTNSINPLTGEEGFSPSFPAFPSGHATMGASAAEALASVFGYAYQLTDRCHQGRTQFEGTPRTFGSFYDMAQENAWSRVLLGVHFRMDADEGVRFGTGIGRKVNNLNWRK